MSSKSFLLLLAVALHLTAGAQTEPKWKDHRSGTINVREFVASLHEGTPDSRILKAPTRGSSPVTPQVRWIDRISNMPEYLVQFYNDYGQKVQEALNGTTNYFIDPSQGTEHFEAWNNAYCLQITEWHEIVDYTYPEDLYGNWDAMEQYAVQAVNDKAQEYWDEMRIFMPYAFVCIDYDFPEAFWTGNVYNYNSGYSYRYGFLTTPGKDKVEFIYRMYFLLKTDDWDYRWAPFNTAEKMRAGITTYKNAVDAILTDAPTSNRYDRIRYLNNRLTKTNAYNSVYGTGNEGFSPLAWSPYSALTGNNGTDGPVCEGYSRAFKVLCDKLDIPCVISVGPAISFNGDTPGAHMWNEVKMNDDKWYAVDVTWNDPVTGIYDVDPKISGVESEQWLLLGSEDLVDRNLTFAQSHINQLMYDNEHEDKWEAYLGSYITTHKYDPATGTANVANDAEPVRVYYISGQFKGAFRSFDEAYRSLEHGIYIINNRKVVK